MKSSHVGIQIDDYFVHTTTNGVEWLFHPPRPTNRALWVTVDAPPSIVYERLFTAQRAGLRVHLAGLVAKGLQLPSFIGILAPPLLNEASRYICTDIVDIALGVEPRHLTPDELYASIVNNTRHNANEDVQH